jgi:hypothetical protein
MYLIQIIKNNMVLQFVPGGVSLEVSWAFLFGALIVYLAARKVMSWKKKN